MDRFWSAERLFAPLTRRLANRSRPSAGDVLVVVVLVAAATGLRALAHVWVERSPVFAIYYPVVLIGALLGGIRLGVFAMGLSTAVVWWLWLPGLRHPPFDVPQAVAAIMFLLTGGLMVAVAAVTPRALRRRMAAEERFRLAQEVSLDGFAILDPIRDASGAVVDFRWSHANAAADAMAPLNYRPLLGRRLLEVFPDFDKRGDYQRYLALLRTGVSYQIEFMRPIDGVERWLRSSGVRIGDSIGVTFRDVTDVVAAHRDLEKRVAERTRDLEASLKERARTEAALARAQRLETVGRLTGGVAHDFNNLLTVVIGGLDMITRATDKPERVAYLASAALAAARRGEQLTRQLLAFSRHRETKSEVVAVAAIMEPLQPLLRRVADESVDLTIQVEPDAGHARLDAAQFEAALLNLVVNAIDATAGGGRVAVRASRATLRDGQIAELMAGDYVLVSVADTGVGMTPEVLEHVFEPYFTTKAIGKGTGLGLAQVYGFVHHSGGAVTIESAPGEGATVSLYLPLVAPSDIESATAAEEAAPKPRAGGQTVLLTEDDEAVRTMTEALLTDLGYRVVGVADGPSALAILQGEQPIDLLMSDVIMPGGMSGVDLAQAARAQRPRLPILLTTGYAAGRLDDVEGLTRWPVLRKPFHAEELAAAIQETLETSLG